jgi:hypothetical protein
MRLILRNEANNCRILKGLTVAHDSPAGDCPQHARESHLKALQFDPERTRIYGALHEIETDVTHP